MSTPLVSVLMNCFNGEQYLREAIESVLAQSWQNWEVIFWDNQSTDNSASIFQSYADPRLKYHYAPSHTKLYEARGLALKHAKGEYIAFLDVDDVWYPSKLSEQIPLFSDQEVGIVCSNYEIYSEIKKQKWISINRYVPSGYVVDFLFKDYFVGLLTLVVRRQALAQLDRGFGTQYNIIGDFDVVVRLAARWKIAYVGAPLGVYRLHGNNESSRSRHRHIEELRQWEVEMAKAPGIGDRAAFSYVRSSISYLSAMSDLLDGDRWKALTHLRQVQNLPSKMKIVLGCLLPTSVVKKIKN